MTAYRLGDIVLIEFPYSDLKGVARRPAIVLYDSGDQDVLVARVTTQEYLTEGDYKIVNWREGGLLAESFVRLGKQATIEKSFIIKRLGALEATEIEKLKSILRRILSLQELSRSDS